MQAQLLPPGVPRVEDTNGNVLFIDPRFTTQAYQQQVLELLIGEANNVVRDINLEDDTPISRSNLTSFFVSPFGYAYRKKKLGNITTQQYFYGVEQADKFSTLAIKDLEQHYVNYRKLYSVPRNQVETNEALALATHWLAALGMDVPKLNEKCKVDVQINSQCNKPTENTFVPVYDVFWESADQSLGYSGHVAMVELLLPTKTLLQFNVYDEKFILRQPIVVPKLDSLFPGEARIITNVPEKVKTVTVDLSQPRPSSGIPITSPRNRKAQTTVEELLSDPKYRVATVNYTGENSTGRMFQTQPLVQALENPVTRKGNRLSLDILLSLTQVFTGREPEIITYELPVKYDVVTNMNDSSLELLLDSSPHDNYQNQPELEECKRAINGDCLLAWNTTVEHPGQHALQAHFVTRVGSEEVDIRGPVVPYFSSNVCQFDLGSFQYDDSKALFCAKLAESNAAFSIEIKTETGKRVKTLYGRTSNGFINLQWDLLDDKGHKFTDESLESCFNIKLLNSGRSQTLRLLQSKFGK